MEKKIYIRDLYRLEGFRAHATMKPHPEDSNGWIITLERRQKKQSARHAGQRHAAIGIDGCIKFGIWMPGTVDPTIFKLKVDMRFPGVAL